jgi:hypothetical protein
MTGSVARGGEKNISLIFDYVYYVMNITYIHLRASDPNIYMYRRGRIYKKKIMKKYNNR